MDDDFNTGGAIGELFELAKITNKFCDDARPRRRRQDRHSRRRQRSRSLLTTIKELANILGIFLQPPAAAGGSATTNCSPKSCRSSSSSAPTARKNKNFAVADKIRDGLAPTGIKLEDRAGGTEWTGGGDGRHSTPS